MPKKLSTNPKAQAARDRKEEKKTAERERLEREKEDALWQDSDRNLERKQKRKENKETKKNDLIQKKLEKKQLLEEEEASLGTSVPAKPGKVSQAEITKRQASIKKAMEMERDSKQAENEHDTLFEGENPNQTMAKILSEEGAVEARNVEDAISVLSVENKKQDKHPEKRMKAAYMDYEKRELPKLKKENPKLRLTQLKEILWKDWMKSPENPMNQV